jgi:hypothetical protein
LAGVTQALNNGEVSRFPGIAEGCERRVQRQVGVEREPLVLSQGYVGTYFTIPLVSIWNHRVKAVIGARQFHKN